MLLGHIKMTRPGPCGPEMSDATSTLCGPDHVPGAPYPNLLECPP